ncbi:MAG TPA: DUF6580 family putative transport protein [bacterium]|nr:DUF6580 family putative transport protein [bacterium]
MRSAPSADRPVWFGTLPYALIAAAALLRLVPHPYNFQPMDALALFGGAVLPGAWAFIVPLAAVALSDAVLGFYGAGMVWVYAAYVVIVILGRTALRRRSAGRVAGAALAAAVVFYLITNAGEWTGPLYRHTPAGLLASFIAGIPFFGNTLLSDLGYSLALFGLHDAAHAAERRRGGLTATQRTT